MPQSVYVYVKRTRSRRRYNHRDIAADHIAINVHSDGDGFLMVVARTMLLRG